MSIPNTTPTVTWNRSTPNDGNLFSAEFAALYANDNDLQSQLNVAETTLQNQINSLSTLNLPIGSILEYDFLDFPANFKIANGQSVSRTTYAALWAKVSRSVTGMNVGANTIQYSGADPVVDQIIKFSFTGGGIIVNTPYFVIAVVSAGNIQVSTTRGGPAVTITASQTGSMLIHNGYGFGDGSTTFNLPDRRGVFPRGAGQHGSRAKAAGGNYDGGSVGQENQDQFQGHRHSMGNGAGVTGGPLTLGVFNGINNYPAPSLSSDNVMDPSTDGSDGTPRKGNETAPASTAVQYLIRVA